MGRNNNTFSLGAGFNITGQEPIDSRLTVSALSDLTSAATWEGVGLYNGLAVSVQEDGTLWILTNRDEYTNSDNWIKVGSDGSGSITAENYTAAVALATADNIGQIIYVLNEEGSYTSGPYIVSGAGTVSKLGTTSATGDIEGDVETLKSNVSALQGQVTELEKLDDLAATSGLKKETNGSLAVKVDPVEGNALTVGADGLKVTIPEVTIPEYTLAEADAATEGYLKSYELRKDGVKVGVSIDIPKDLVVTAGEVKTVETADTPYAGAIVGDLYLQLTIANQATPVYIPVKKLTDVYTAGAYLTLNNGEFAVDYESLKDQINTDLIVPLSTRVTTAEGKITVIEEKLNPEVEGSIAKDVETLKSSAEGLRTDVDALETTVGTAESGLVKDVADLKTNVAAIKVKDVDTASVNGIQLGLDAASGKVKVNAVSATDLGAHVSPGVDATKVKLGVDITDGAEENPQVIISKDATLPEAIQTLSDKVESAIAGGITGISGDTYIKVSGSSTSKSLTLDAVAVGKAMPATGSAIVADQTTGKLDLFWDVIE
jgi:hypothetical protein